MQARGDVGQFHGLAKELILGHRQVPKNRLAFAAIKDLFFFGMANADDRRKNEDDELGDV